jgi:hypothetical protein
MDSHDVVGGERTPMSNRRQPLNQTAIIASPLHHKLRLLGGIASTKALRHTSDIRALNLGRSKALCWFETRPYCSIKLSSRSKAFGSILLVALALGRAQGI